MKGKIDKDGYLEIFRGDDWKRQECPFIPVIEHSAGCGDWCPQFGEPMRAADCAQPDDHIYLDICQNHTLMFTDFTDERGKG